MHTINALPIFTLAAKAIVGVKKPGAIIIPVGINPPFAKANAAPPLAPKWITGNIAWVPIPDWNNYHNCNCVNGEAAIGAKIIGVKKPIAVNYAKPNPPLPIIHNVINNHECELCIIRLIWSQGIYDKVNNILFNNVNFSLLWGVLML